MTTKSAKLAQLTFSHRMTFRSGLEDRNADGWVNSDDDPATFDRNFASFRSATPKFKRLECVQQA